MAAATGGTPVSALQARDVVAFGQEFGRVLSDGRIVGRAEPFAKVFASSRAVKRAVGVTAWAILEDIALDASIDVEGRLVAETNVRAIAANLGLSKNTVTTHLARLRDHGFVLHEEQRDDGTGRYETSRYVLDPSACLERFTHTPKAAASTADEPCPKNWDTDPEDPCPKNWDTATVSQSTGHRDLGQKNKNKRVVVEEEQQQPDSADDGRGLVGRLTALRVAADRAQALVAEHPPERIADALDAVEVAEVRNPAGWVVTAIQAGWELAGAAEQRRAQRQSRDLRARQHAARQAAQEAEDACRRRIAGWEAAVSAALDDDDLVAALRQVTTEVPGLGRRSAPMATASLVAWASACLAAEPGVPLDRLLPAALTPPSTSAALPPTDADRELPEPPGGHDDLPEPTSAGEPLRERVARLLPALDLDLDLQHPSTTQEEQR